MAVTILDSTNNGNVNGDSYVGGFVGYIGRNTNMTMTISNSINNGNVTGSGWYVGGFVGEIKSNENMTMAISNSTNNGNVNGSSTVGGFVGSIGRNTNTVMTISSSNNNGNVNGSSTVGGLVGEIDSYPLSNSISLFIINSANKGSVSAKHYMTCGVFCVDPDFNFNVNTTIMNSINKGSVNAGSNAFGITNIIIKARNVVSMGDVNASSGFNSFWKSSTDVDLFFGLKSKCKNCGAKAKLFEQNTNTWF